MRYIFAALISLISASALAQSPINSFPPGIFANRNDPAPVLVVGPGDIQSGALAWYGLRAYNASYASPGTNKAIKIQRADTHNCDLVINTAGNLGNTANCSTGGDNNQSALSFIGVHGTCSGTISGTTLSCTSATVTPSVGDQLSAAGTVGLIVASCGTFTGGTGTCTLTAAPVSNIGVAETVTFVNDCVVINWYDQSGNGHDLSTNSNVRFNPIGTNGTLPVNVTTEGPGFFNPATIPSTNPTYYTAIVNRQINSTTQMGVIGVQDDTLAPSGAVLFYFTTANVVDLYAGSLFGATSVETKMQAIQGLIASGASSVINVDGTETTGTTGTGQSNTQLWVGLQGNNGGGQHPLQGIINEAGAWVASPNSTVRTSMCNNMRLYWGTSGSC